jgi:hypothetical protein
MLSHDNVTWTAQTSSDLFQAQKDDCCVAFLPLSHIAEQMFTIHIPPVSGHKVNRSSSTSQPPGLACVPGSSLCRLRGLTLAYNRRFRCTSTRAWRSWCPP